MVMQNTATDHIDLIPLDPKASPVASFNEYNGNTIRPLVRLFYSSDDPAGFSGGVHISCNVAGYCVVSTYYEPDAPERNWLDRTIILVKLDPNQPKAWHLAKVHNTTGAYWEETQASISRDGSRIVLGLQLGQRSRTRTGVYHGIGHAAELAGSIEVIHAGKSGFVLLNQTVS